MENKQQPWYYSWGVIVLALIFFWPAGLALLVLRMNHSKSSVTFGKSQKTLLNVAAGFLFFIAFGMFVSDEPFMGILFILGGIVVLYFSRKASRRSERYRQYINMIVNQEIQSIDTIAAMNNTSYETVLSDLNKMVEQGILKNAVIDQMSRTVIVPNARPVEQPQMAYGGGVSSAVSAQKITVSCPGCGAKMAVAKGSVCNCEYCDTPVSA